MSTPEETAAQTANVETADSTTATEENALNSVVENEAAETEEYESEDAHEETVSTGSAPGAQKRIQQLSAQRKVEQEARIKAELEREYYKGLAENRGSSQPAPQAPVHAAPAIPDNMPPIPPVLDNFESFEEYETAKDRYTVALTKHEIMREMQQMQQQQVRQQQATATVTKLESAAKEDPVFAQIWSNKALWDTLPISASMAEVIAISPDATEVIKWVHANRAEASRIAALSPVLAAREIAMVEARLKAAPKPAPPKRVSQAPEPIQTINPSSSGAMDEDDLPMDEYYRRRTKQLYKR